MSDQTADPHDTQRIRERLETVSAEVRRASTAAHGDPEAVRILLATKTQPAARIRAAIEAGAGLIGENRVQELQEKAPELADLPHEAHLIGPLQRNKVNHTLRAGAVCVQSIDSLAVAQKLSDRIATLTAEGPQELAAEAPGTTRMRYPRSRARRMSASCFQGASGRAVVNTAIGGAGSAWPGSGTGSLPCRSGSRSTPAHEPFSGPAT